MSKKIILAIESSCDETAAAVVVDGREVLSNVIASQIETHKKFGGVVPEVASRMHIEVVDSVVKAALEEAKVSLEDIDAIGVTYGPGLVGALLVGLQYAKGLSLGSKKPLIAVNHIQGHISANFIQHKDLKPPFVSLVVSGGHTFIVYVKGYRDFEVISQTRDDAAGEAFDKCGKVMGLPYPAGPLIDKLAKEGNKNAFIFAKPSVKGLDFSFSGLKTSFLYFLRDRIKEDPDFIEKNKADLCASLQHVIVSILIGKLTKASLQTGISEIGIAGGVSANSGLRNGMKDEAEKRNWNLFIPEFKYTTDNAAMIGITGYYKYLRGEFSGQDVTPLARL